MKSAERMCRYLSHLCCWLSVEQIRAVDAHGRSYLICDGYFMSAWVPLLGTSTTQIRSVVTKTSEGFSTYKSAWWQKQKWIVVRPKTKNFEGTRICVATDPEIKDGRGTNRKKRISRREGSTPMTRLWRFTPLFNIPSCSQRNQARSQSGTPTQNIPELGISYSVIGILSVSCGHPNSARIRVFFVRPDWARRGIGRALLLKCEHEARHDRFRSASLVATLTG
jgi:hypothetical protein